MSTYRTVEIRVPYDSYHPIGYFELLDFQ